MNAIKNPTKLAFIYSAVSVILGPLILLLGYGFTRGGGDYCDAVYYLADGSLDPRRITEFQNALLFQVTGASIMLYLGATILIYSVVQSYRKKSKLSIPAVLLVLFMMFGYILVILMSGANGQSC